MKKQKSAELLSVVQEFHAEWSKRSQGERHGGFKVALFRERRNEFRALQLSPALMRNLPDELLADWPGKQGRPIGEKTLQDLMPQIVRAWRKQNPQPTLEDFVNQLLAKYKNKATLERAIT